MKQKVLVIAVGIAMALGACSKNSFTPACETNDTGTLIVDSHQPHPFNIYLDGAYLGQVPAHGNKSFTVSTQTYALTANRADGGGAQHSLSLTIYQCQSFTAQLY